MRLNKNTSYCLVALLQGKTTATSINTWLNINTTRSTQRALQALEALGLTSKRGPSNSPTYQLVYRQVFSQPITTKIFEDERRPQSHYNYGLLDYLESINEEELASLFGLPAPVFEDASIDKRELENLTIELSWKSSALEGNTYSLLDTELLVREGLRAKGKTDFETQMILNHKQAIDFIRDNANLFRSRIKPSTVIELHKIIGFNIGIKSGVRKKVVHISSSNYQPEPNPHKLRESLERSLGIINRAKNPYVKALLALGLVPYLQYFEDGNKRTGRLLSNALLISSLGVGYSLRNIDAKELAIAYIALYELNNLEPLARILKTQLKGRG